jgi:CcmD family protein
MMEVNGEFVATIAVGLAILGFLYRLDMRVSRVESRILHIEGLLEGYFMQAIKKDDAPQ